tara:strand:+ start:141 stop:950 length:810 start_codon:yes stop_codon:yes gene_type:complete
MQESEESNMPKGKNKYMGGGMTDEYFDGGMVTNDARNRNVNTMGDGFAPKPSPKPMMPSEPSNEVEGSYVDPYNEDIAPVITAGGMYKKGGRVDEEGLTDKDKAFMKDALANKKDILTPEGLRIAKKIAKAEAKLKKEKEKSKPKYGKDAKSQQEKKIKRFTAGGGKAIEKSEGSQYETKGTSVIEKEGKIYKRKPKMAKGGKALKKGKGLKNTKGGIKSTKGKPKKFRKPEAGENKFTGKYNEKAVRRALTKEEAREKGKKNVFRRKK